MVEKYPEVSTKNLEKGTPIPVEKEKSKEEEKSDDGGFNLKNPFSREPDWKDKEVIGKSLFKDTREAKRIPKLMSSWLTQAFMAGEKAAQEKKQETDMTKILGAMAVGFTLGFILIKSGLLPT